MGGRGAGRSEHGVVRVELKGRKSVRDFKNIGNKDIEEGGREHTALRDARHGGKGRGEKIVEFNRRSAIDEMVA